MPALPRITAFRNLPGRRPCSGSGRTRLPRRLALLAGLGLLASTSVGASASRAAEPQESTAGPVRLRVLSYNIHHGEGSDGQLDLERIAAIIRDADADLVALQEVDQKTARTGRVDQPAELARLTGMHVCFGANLQLEGGAYGTAILSRFPIVSHQNQPLPNLDASEPRGLLAAEIAVPGMPQPLRFLCTHLDHRRPEANRLASVAEIERLFGDAAATPMVLAGDLNAVPTSEPLQRLRKQWRSANQEPRLTIPVENPNRQIDYVLYRPAEAWQALSTEVLDEPQASDHLPLLAVLQWSPK